MKPLSPDNRFLNMLLPSILLVVVGLIVFKFGENYLRWELILTLGAMGVLLLFWFRIGWRKKNLFYDDSSLFLRGHGDEIKLPLSNISQLSFDYSSRLKILGVSYRECRIDFKDGQNETGSVTFWVSSMGSKLEDFETVVKKNNPEVRV